MSTEDEIRRVEKAIDDLQSTVETHTYIMMGCTQALMGTIMFTSTKDLGNIILGMLVMMIGIFLVLYNLNIYKKISNIIYSRKTNRL